MNIYSSYFHNCLKLKATNMSFSRQMDKHKLVQHNGILFNNLRKSCQTMIRYGGTFNPTAE